MTTFKKGDRVGLRPDCLRTVSECDWSKQKVRSIIGTVLAKSIFVEQEWVPILWDDKQDPLFCKAGVLERR